MTALRDLLLWARKERIVLGQVTIGACTVTVLDLGVNRDAQPKSRNRAPDIRQMFAGAARGVMAEAGVIADDPDDDEAVQ